MKIILLLLALPLIALGDANHWAFERPTPSSLPPVIGSVEERSPIDRWILNSLEKADFAPSPPADPMTLFRRLSLDLRGFPPTPDEIRSFLKDDHPNAWDRQIDQWLASPTHGERLTQDWLDLARYADTTGHAADMPRAMWPYRDWVIDAFNMNKGFDNFTIEQLAGDLLPQATEEQRIATGFHRNAMQGLGENLRKEEFRVKGVVDRVDTTSQTWLGLSIACAECHDHLHDPISNRDYYSFFAFFNNVPHEGEGLEVHGPQLNVQRLINGRPEDAVAHVIEELPEPRTTHVHVRGHYENLGEIVHPDVPASLPPLPENVKRDRLALAQWLFARHPLTARVAVNRLWKQCFGEGIVRTENDFGKNGQAPSNPDLLDWLALELENSDWDLKWLRREILCSTTYRQGSRYSTADPKNLLFARQNRFRLSAEQIRDQALVASELLVSEMGGPSVYPPQPVGVGAFRDSTAGKWETSQGKDRYRRSIYTFWQRMSPYPSLALFDMPARETCVSKRSASNTPMQALITLNDPVYMEMAHAFGVRMALVPPDEAMNEAFLCWLTRCPTPEEKQWFEAYLEEEMESFQHDPTRLRDWHKHAHELPLPMTIDEQIRAAGWGMVGSVLMNLDEALNRP